MKNAPLIVIDQRGVFVACIRRTACWGVGRRPAVLTGQEMSVGSG
jgi:hypothetical protein